MIDFITAPWLLGDWMWRGTLATVLVAVPSAMLGVFLYLRRMSLVADALTHIAVLGIAATFLITGSVHPLVMVAGAVVVGVISTSFIQVLSAKKKVREDAAIGIVFTVAFALGVILLSVFVKGAHIDTHCLLFGDVLGMSNDALMLLGVVAPIVVLGILLGYRWLAAVSFDELFAKNLGIPVTLIHYVLMTAVSTTAVASFEAVGAILSVAMIVVPAACAHLLTHRLHSMLAIAVAHGLVSAVVGMYMSIAFDVSSAGSIVMVGGLLYFIAFVAAPEFGLIARVRHKRMLRTQKKMRRAPTFLGDAA